MKTLALEKEAPGLTATDFGPHFDAEAARAWDSYQAGVIREMYFHADAEEAAAMLAALPLVQHGLISSDLIPLRAYPGFARLFASDED